MSESPNALPPRPSLEQLRKRAKDLLRDFRSGEGAAIERVRASLPRLADPAVAGDVTLADVQYIMARELGFVSWAKLVHHVEAERSIDLPFGLSGSPPFYKIDWERGSIEPRQPMSGADWERIFGVMKDLHLTCLNARGQIGDDDMKGLAKLDFVTSLGLDGAERLTDDGLLQLTYMPQLTELDLSHTRGRLTDRGLLVLQNLPELRRLQMCWQGNISDAGTASLAHCHHLERVDLMGTPTGDGAIKAMGGKTRLRHFKTGRLVTDAGLSLLHELPVFKTWQGGPTHYDLMTFGDAEPNYLTLDGPISDAGLQALAGLDGVFGLNFFWHASAMTPEGLRVLGQLPHLGALGCEGRLCDDVAMRHIAAIPRLRLLMAQGTVATDEGFETLSRSPTLEYLWGRECPNLRGRGFAALARLPALKGLAVSCKHVDDAALATLERFPALSWLLPMDVPDVGFRHVGRCSQLEKLTCMYCRDTGDAATEQLAGLSRLKYYYAGRTQITDRSLDILGGMTSLEVVELSACASISNAGLASIARLPRLKKVSVDATARVTRAGLEVFPENVQVLFWT